MTAPKLRFKEFDGSWEKNSIQYFMDKKYILDQMDGNHGELYPKSEEFSIDGIPYVSATDFSSGEVDFNSCKRLPLPRAKLFKKGIAKNGDVLFAHNATVGPVTILKTDLDFVILSTTATYYRCDDNYLQNIFLKNYFESEYFIQQYFGIMSQSTRNQVPITTQRKLFISIPQIEEQTKIATFLSAVDEKINQLTQKHQLLSQYKQGMMQKLFSQQIRFKADDGSEFGEWEEKPLNYFLYTSKLKNKNLKYSKNEVLSVSGEIGIVNQIELLGRSYAGVSVAPYGVVEHGDIVYTKSPLKSNPYGIIKANKGKSGIVSTLYAIYKCRENIIPNLVDYYFQNDMKLNHFLKPLVKKGAKNDMKVNNDHVLTGLVCFPSSIEEQTKIVNFLSTIDQKIDVVSEQLEQAKLWKKGLLQQMFV